MRAIDVLANLKNFDCWDFKHYPLTKDEAEVIIQILEATCTGGVANAIPTQIKTTIIDSNLDKFAKAWNVADVKITKDGLWAKAIKADDIKKDDEWMQDDKWDEIYKQVKD